MTDKVNEFAATRTLPDLMCRNLRHAWRIDKFRAATHEEAKARSLLHWDQVIVREVECLRCGTVKVEFFARDKRTDGFVRVKGGYQYPKGYLFKSDGEVEKPSRWDYFAELLERDFD